MSLFFVAGAYGVWSGVWWSVSGSRCLWWPVLMVVSAGVVLIVFTVCLLFGRGAYVCMYVKSITACYIYTHISSIPYDAAVYGSEAGQR